ncbi:hypothetical protein GNT69_21085 [Bacillus sp. B15-48]|nr:hypothetical protein [Bacillus sp. B15-48]
MSKKNGLMERMDLTEAVIDLAGWFPINMLAICQKY